MNETLEAMGQNVFDDWFVRFGPTRAKIGGREPYLPPDIWSLFPNTLVGSELGEIPEAWEVRSVSDVASVRGGKQLPKDKFIRSGPVPVFGGGVGGVMGYTNITNADGYVISVGRVGAYCGQFFSHRGRAWINNNASHIAHLDHIPGDWLLLSLQNLDVERIKRGSAQPYITNSDLGAMKIVVPPASILDIFESITGAWFQRAALFKRRRR